jgi:osmotically-inducible protein OsmY
MSGVKGATMKRIVLRSWLASVLCAVAASLAHAQSSSSSSGSSTGSMSSSGSSSSGSTSATGVGTGASRVGSTSASGSPFAGSAASNFANQSVNSQLNTQSTTTSANSVPSQYDPFRTTYVNPYAAEQTVIGSLATGRSKNASFGQPLYFSTTTQSQSNVANNSANQQQNGFTTLNMKKAPSYITALHEDLTSRPLYNSAVVQRELQSRFDRSNRLKGKAQVQVTVEGPIVVLTGQAATERDRRLAEALVRMEPGVQSVDNRLAVTGQP